MIYKIAICEDEKTQAAYVLQLLEKWSDITGNQIKINQFKNAEAFLFSYEERKDYDILLLDIQLGKMDGIELAKKIRKYDENVVIIFITGFSDFLAQGYEVFALHYLLKPVKEEKFFEVLGKACKFLNKKEKTIIFCANGEMRCVPIDKIMYVESFAHYLSIQMIEETFTVRMSMAEAKKLLEEQENGEFVQCHRSYLVSIRHISKITRTQVILDNKTSLPLSRNSYNRVNQAFIRYYTKEE